MGQTLKKFGQKKITTPKKINRALSTTGKDFNSVKNKIIIQGML
jgi:hypothetical protein